jgi:thiol-disulfide isomerase/thioredoxin
VTSIPTPPAVRPPRRGLIGPFTGRQLLSIVGIVAVVAVVLSLATAPIAPGSGGLPSAFPGATPFLVGSPTVGLQAGDLAPEFEVTLADGTPAALQDLGGNPVTLASLKGKLVWVNFWASWCPPCQAETPVLREMDEAYGDRGLAIVAIAVQETTVDNIAAYAQRYELDFPIAFDARADVFRRYQVYALPTQFFIGADGRVLQVVNGPMSEATAKERIEAWLPKDASAQ